MFEMSNYTILVLFEIKNLILVDVDDIIDITFRISTLWTSPGAYSLVEIGYMLIILMFSTHDVGYASFLLNSCFTI